MKIHSLKINLAKINTTQNHKNNKFLMKIKSFLSALISVVTKSARILTLPKLYVPT